MSDFYRKKPVVIEAIHLSGPMALDECAGFCSGDYAWINEYGSISQLSIIQIYLTYYFIGCMHR